MITFSGFSSYIDSGEVHEDWWNTYIMPLHKGERRHKYESLNYKGIILLSVCGKLYGSIMIEVVVTCTEHQIGEE